MFNAIQVLAVVAAVVVQLRIVLAVPRPANLNGARSVETSSSIVTRSVPSAPHFVVYSDDWVTGAIPPVSSVKGYNVFALSFLLPSGAVDQAQNWASLTDAQRSSALSTYHAAGISIIVSAFGSTIEPTNEGLNAVDTANTMAQWVIDYGLDGIDVDYEDLDSFDNGGGDAEAWLITFTTTLRQSLPQGQYILSHAPLAPWFAPSVWSGGGYLAVDKAVGHLIDWYNVQFYNQGSTEYTDCAGLLTASSDAWPETALFQIATNGPSLNKLVIGKPATAIDASNGYIDPGTLAQCAQQASAQGWNAGVMVWEFPDAEAAWVSTVQSGWNSGGGGGGGSPPPTTSHPSSPTHTSTPPPPSRTSTTHSSSSSSAPSGGGGGGSGNCAGVAAWQSGVAYIGGSRVTYNGHLWTANWWSEDDAPGGLVGDWRNDGACTGSNPVEYLVSPKASVTPLSQSATHTHTVNSARHVATTVA